MFVRWNRRRLPDWTCSASRCPHQGDRDRLTPVVMLSYKAEAGVSKHYVVWRPGVSINACCLADVTARVQFWRGLEKQIAALGEPPADKSAGAVLLDRLDWLRAEIGKRVPYPTDDELVEMVAEQMRSQTAQ